MLAAQRDHYLPLRVIKEHLDAIDRGLQLPAASGGGPRVPHIVVDASASPDSFGDDGRRLRLSRAELLEGAEVDEDLLGQLEDFGLVVPRGGRAPYDADDLVVTRMAGRLAAFGLQPRHLRPFKAAADREVGLVEQLVVPLRRQRSADARARADEVSREVAALSVGLHAALVRASLHRSPG